LACGRRLRLAALRRQMRHSLINSLSVFESLSYDIKVYHLL
jgi:hypothetical protein